MSRLGTCTVKINEKTNKINDFFQSFLESSEKWKKMAYTINYTNKVDLVEEKSVNIVKNFLLLHFHPKKLRLLVQGVLEFRKHSREGRAINQWRIQTFS